MAAVLLLIDVQRNMLEPPEPVTDAPAVAEAIVRILARARSAGASVIHVRNNGGPDDPDAPGAPGWELATEVLGGEQIVDKHEANSFAGTVLADLIPTPAEVVVVGMQSEYCVRDTALAATRCGHSVSLVRGAHATYDDERSAAEITRNVEQELERAGVAVVDVADVRFS